MFDLFQADGMKNGGFAENLQETACGGSVRSTGCRKYDFSTAFLEKRWRKENDEKFLGNEKLITLYKSLCLS